MILSRIPEIHKDMEELRELAPSGFVVALDVKWSGPAHLHSEFPRKWRSIYEQKAYFMFDPVYYWILMNTGITRWSEINYPDPRSIASKAAVFGLVYGATVCRTSNAQKSFLSAARADRELSDDELERMDTLLRKWIDIVHQTPELTDAEIDILVCLRDGLDQNEIAAKLGLSVSTVKKRLQSVRAAFKAKTTTEAVSIATEKRFFSNY